MGLPTNDYLRIISKSYGPRKPMVVCEASSLDMLADLDCAEGSTATVGDTEYVLDRVNGWVEPGGGGSGVLVVTGTYEGDIETLDKTWQEIIDALSSGKIVCHLLVDDNYVDIGYCTGGNWVEPITTGSVRFIMMGANGIEEVAYSTTAKDGYPSHDWSGS